MQPRNYTWGWKDVVKRVLYQIAAWANEGEIMNVVAVPVPATRLQE